MERYPFVFILLGIAIPLAFLMVLTTARQLRGSEVEMVKVHGEKMACVVYRSAITCDWSKP